MTKENLIRDIINRAFTFSVFQNGYDRLSFAMDIDAVKDKIDLEKFLDFDDFNFMHDATGIVKHLNRETLELEDYFLPRCSKSC